MPKLQDRKYGSLDAAKTVARRFAARGNELGWKVVVGKLHDKGTYSWRIAFMADPDMAGIAHFEPMAVYASKALGKLPKPNPVTPMDKPIGYKDVEHGPGWPYEPSPHRHFLYRTPKRVHGKKFYVTIDGTARTWLTDKRAAAWLANAMRNPAGIPPSVERYYQETKVQNPDMPEPKAWAIAWSRYCKYKAPDSGHCRLSRADYFPGRGGKGSDETMKKNPHKINDPEIASLLAWLSDPSRRPEQYDPFRQDYQAAMRAQELGLIELDLVPAAPGHGRYRLTKKGAQMIQSGHAMKNPAKIIPFPVGGRRGVAANVNPMGPAMDTQLRLRQALGDEVAVHIVEPGSELAVSFEPGTLVIYPGPAAHDGTPEALARLGATVSDAGGVVMPRDMKAFYDALGVKLAVASESLMRPPSRPSSPKSRPKSAPKLQIPEDFGGIYKLFVATLKKAAPSITVQKGSGSVYGWATVRPGLGDYSPSDKRALLGLLGDVSNYISVQPTQQRDYLRKWVAAGIPLPKLGAPKPKSSKPKSPKSPRASKPGAAVFKLSGVDAGFQTAFDRFMRFSQAIVDKNWATYKNIARPILYAQDGRRYVRVVRRDYPDAQSGSAHVFVDKTNGDILKPASWKAPAKHARGNILAMDYDKWMGPYGTAYLR